MAVTTTLKIIPLVAMATIGLFFMNLDHFTPFNPSGGSIFATVTAVAVITLWALIGLESATVPAEDVVDPERTIPRATVPGTIVAAAIYILATTAVLRIVPIGTLATSTAPFADPAELHSGDGPRTLVALAR
ncbi:MAG: amino acid permease [Acidimicrobiia bacterium]